MRVVRGSTATSLVNETVDRTHRAGDEQRVSVGKVAVRSLTSDPEFPGDVGQTYRRSVFGNHFVYRIQNAGDCLLIRGGRRSRPAATTHPLPQAFRP